MRRVSMRSTSLGLALLFMAWPVLAELRPLAEDELQGISGQAGLSISASLNFAANPAQTRCPGGCGTRVAIQPANSSGFIVLDNIQGAFNASAMRLGLTDASFNNARVTLAGSNSATSGGAGFQQTDLLTYQANGDVRLQGNLYIFAAP